MSKFPNWVYVEIRVMLETLGEVEPVKGAKIPIGLPDLLHRLAYPVPILRHNEVVEFLKQVQIDRE